MSNIFKKWFGKPDSGGGGDKAAPPAVRWMDAHESPWGVPVIDLRPFSLTMLSTSNDPRMASNAVSFMADDGTGFADETLPSPTINCELRFPIDRALVEGALFQPCTMEEKWALYSTVVGCSVFAVGPVNCGLPPTYESTVTKS